MTVAEILSGVAALGCEVVLESSGPQVRRLRASATLSPQLLADLKDNRRAVVAHLMLARAAERGKPLFWLDPDAVPTLRMGMVKGGVIPDEARYLTTEGDKSWVLMPRQ